MTIDNLKDALARIAELEEENRILYAELRDRKAETELLCRKWSEEANTFIVGGVEFTALRRDHPRIPGKPMWLVQVNESGEVWEPGAGGVSNESRPKMQADLEDLYQFGAKRDHAEWRRQLKLPAGEPSHERA